MKKTFGLLFEFAAIFIGCPIFFYFHGSRWGILVALWMVAVYAFIYIFYNEKFSWSEIWRGKGWNAIQKRNALARCTLVGFFIIGLTLWLAPDRLLSLPVRRPGFWLIMMVLYPALSALPQELLFRSFFFRRYRTLFPGRWAMIIASVASFGFMHVVFHNWVSPVLSFLAGLIFANSYRQHESLKWAAIEHAAYGCMIFTAGIGSYFLIGGMLHP